MTIFTAQPEFEIVGLRFSGGMCYNCLRDGNRQGFSQIRHPPHNAKVP